MMLKNVMNLKNPNEENDMVLYTGNPADIKTQLSKHIDSMGSDTETNYYDDYSVTIFLKNGYRIISNKEVLGSSLSIEYFNEKPPPENTSEANIYSEVFNDVLPNMQSTPAKYYTQNANGKNKALSKEEFLNSVDTIVPSEVFNFLQKRHSYLLFKTEET